MIKKKYIFERIIGRFKSDLFAHFEDLHSDPFAVGRTKKWESNFHGEITKEDHLYGAFLILLSLIPAVVVAQVSEEPQWKILAQFFAAPMHTLIIGFLTAVLFLVGTHLNRTPKTWPYVFKLMLRVLSLYPFMAFLNLWSLGSVFILIVYGFFVVRSATKSYSVKFIGAFLFYEICLIAFALLQLKQNFTPVGQNSIEQKFQLEKSE